MSDILEVFRQMATCPFCRNKFSDVVKLIPDCGNFICGACCQELADDLDVWKRYKCEACNDHHMLPGNGFPVCKQLVGLLRHSAEKPLSEQAKKLKLLIENVQEDLARLEAFDPKDHIEHHCLQLEHEVSQTAASAVKHINVPQSGHLPRLN